MFKSSALKLNDSDAAFRRRGAAGVVSGKRGKQSQIRQADIVNSKRLGSILTMAREAQLASNESRSKSYPSRPFPTASTMQWGPFLNTAAGTRRVRPVHMLHHCAIICGYRIARSIGGHGRFTRSDRGAHLGQD